MGCTASKSTLVEGQQGTLHKGKHGSQQQQQQRQQQQSQAQQAQAQRKQQPNARATPGPYVYEGSETSLETPPTSMVSSSSRTTLQQQHQDQQQQQQQPKRRRKQQKQPKGQPGPSLTSAFSSVQRPLKSSVDDRNITLSQSVLLARNNGPAAKDSRSKHKQRQRLQQQQQLQEEFEQQYPIFPKTAEQMAFVKRILQKHVFLCSGSCTPGGSLTDEQLHILAMAAEPVTYHRNNNSNSNNNENTHPNQHDATTTTAPTDSVVITAGDASNYFYILQSGVLQSVGEPDQAANDDSDDGFVTGRSTTGKPSKSAPGALLSASSHHNNSNKNNVKNHHYSHTHIDMNEDSQDLEDTLAVLGIETSAPITQQGKLIHVPGTCFGELELLLNKPAKYTVEVISNTATLYHIDYLTYTQVLHKQIQQTTNDKIMLLENIPFLRVMSEDVIRQMAAEMVPVLYHPGDKLLRRRKQNPQQQHASRSSKRRKSNPHHKSGNSSSSKQQQVQQEEEELKCFIIHEGEVQVTDYTVGDCKFEDSVLRSGDYFGERVLVVKNADAAVAAAAISAKVTALTKVFAYTLDKETVERVLRELANSNKRRQDKKMLGQIKVIKDSRLGSAKLALLSTMIEDRQFKKGTKIVVEGETVDPALYLVRQGALRITSRSHCKNRSGNTSDSDDDDDDSSFFLESDSDGSSSSDSSSHEETQVQTRIVVAGGYFGEDQLLADLPARTRFVSRSASTSDALVKKNALDQRKATVAAANSLANLKNLPFLHPTHNGGKNSATSSLTASQHGNRNSARMGNDSKTVVSIDRNSTGRNTATTRSMATAVGNHQNNKQAVLQDLRKFAMENKNKINASGGAGGTVSVLSSNNNNKKSHGSVTFDDGNVVGAGNSTGAAAAGSNGHGGVRRTRSSECAPATTTASYTVEVLEHCTVGILKLRDCRSVFDTRFVGRGLRAAESGARQWAMTGESIKDDLEKKRLLGQGAFGQVWLATEKSVVGTPYALKIQSKYELIQYDRVEDVVRERQIMGQLHHPFIMRLVHTEQDDQFLYMLLGFVQGGELQRRNEATNFKGIPERDSRFYAACIHDALFHMHRRMVVYRDLKPENVLIDEEGYVVIADFGFAKFVEEKTYTFSGTPLYMAPEVIKSVGHGKAVDHWALGVLIYEMLTGCTPFYHQGMSQVELFRNICAGKIPRRENKISASAFNLIERLLRKDPNERIGSLARGERDISEHNWFAEDGIDWEKLRNKEIEAPWHPHSEFVLDTTNFQKLDTPDKTEQEFPALSEADQKRFERF